MKIRTGFVSNSSSSSFCVLGYETDLGSVLKAFRIKPKWDDDDYDKNYTFWENAQEKIEKQGFNIIVDSECLGEQDDAMAIIGVDIEGFNVGEILELACQAGVSKMDVLKKKLEMGEPTVRSGEYNY